MPLRARGKKKLLKILFNYFLDSLCFPSKLIIVWFMNIGAMIPKMNFGITEKH